MEKSTRNGIIVGTRRSAAGRVRMQIILPNLNDFSISDLFAKLVYVFARIDTMRRGTALPCPLGKLITKRRQASRRSNAIGGGADKEASQRRHHAEVSSAEPGQCGESATAVDGGADTEQGPTADRQ